MMVKLLYRHPNPLVMAQNPRILDFQQKGMETQFYEPKDELIEIDGHKIQSVTYTVNEQYGRTLLSCQPDRYFLLEPKSMFVKQYSDNKLGSQTVKIQSILETKYDYAKPEVEPIVDSISEELFKPIETQTAQQAIEAKHALDFAVVDEEEVEELKILKTPKSPKNPLSRPDL